MSSYQPVAWNNWTSLTAATTSNITVYPYVQGVSLAPVLDSPSAKLSDRDWLDAQITEVCDLAVAA